jgi:hypothetical protein
MMKVPGDDQRVPKTPYNDGITQELCLISTVVLLAITEQ